MADSVEFRGPSLLGRQKQHFIKQTQRELLEVLKNIKTLTHSNLKSPNLSSVIHQSVSLSQFIHKINSSLTRENFTETNNENWQSIIRKLAAIEKKIPTNRPNRALLIRDIALLKENIFSLLTSHSEFPIKPSTHLSGQPMETNPILHSIEESQDTWDNYPPEIIGHFFYQPITDTYLEGAKSRPMMAFLNEALNKYSDSITAKKDTKASKKIKQIQESLAAGLGVFDSFDWNDSVTNNTASLIAYLTPKLNGLGDGANMLIPFGYNSGFPVGHATYLEIIKTGKTFTIRHYNLGEGVNEYHKTLSVPHKHRDHYIPYIEIRDVSTETLIDESFIRAYLELQKEKYPEPQCFSSHQCYGLVEFLASKGSNKKIYFESDTLARYADAQHSGNCAWYSLIALCKTKLSREEFARFFLYTGLDILTHFKTTKIDENSPNIADYEIFKLSLEQLFREFRATHDCFTDNEKKAVQQLQSWHRTVSEKITELEHQVLKVTPHEKCAEMKQSMYHSGMMKITDSDPIRVSTPAPITFPKSFKNIDGINGYIGQTLTSCQALLTLDTSSDGLKEILISASQAILHLPKPTETFVWKELSIEQLTTLSKLMTQCCAQLTKSGLDHTFQTNVALAQYSILALTLTALDPQNQPQNEGEQQNETEQKFREWFKGLKVDFELLPKFLYTESSSPEGDYNFYSLAQHHHFTYLKEFFAAFNRGRNWTFSTIIGPRIEEKTFNLTNDDPYIQMVRHVNPNPSRYNRVLSLTQTMACLDDKLPNKVKWLMNQTIAATYCSYCYPEVLKENDVEVSRLLDHPIRLTINSPPNTVDKYQLNTLFRTDPKKSQPYWGRLSHDSIKKTLELRKNPDLRVELLRFKNEPARGLSRPDAHPSRDQILDLSQLLSVHEENKNSVGIHLTDLITYFSQHSHLLIDDVLKDQFQEFFKCCCCEHSLNKENLDSIQNLEEELTTFITSMYEKCNAQNFHAAACFFIKMMIFIEPRLKLANPDASFNIIEKINQDSFPEEFKGVLHQMKVAYYGQYPSKTLPDPDGFIVSCNYVKENPVDSIYADSTIEFLFDNAILLHSPTITKPISTGIPKDLLEDHSFKRLFPITLPTQENFHQINYGYQTNYEDYEINFIKKPGELYYTVLLTSNGKTFKLINVEELEKFLVGTSFRSKKEKESKDFLTDRLINTMCVFVQDCTQFDLLFGVENGILFINPKTKQEYAHGTVHRGWHHVETITRAVDNKVLLSIKDSNLKFLSRIDAPYFIECWGEDGTCDEIEFLRLGLTFKRNDSNQFVCDNEELKGFFIEPDQYAHGWRGFTDFLRLSNGHETKLLVPCRHLDEEIKHPLTGYPIKDEDKDKLSLVKDVSIQKDRDLPQTILPLYLCFDSDPPHTNDGMLQKLYKTFLFYAMEDYEKTFDLIEETLTAPVPLSSQELNIMSWILTLFCSDKENKKIQPWKQNGNPEASAVFLKLSTKILTLYGHVTRPLDDDQAETVKSMLEFIQENISKEYDNYLSVAEPRQCVSLTDEEVSIINKHTGNLRSDRTYSLQTSRPLKQGQTIKSQSDLNLFDDQHKISGLFGLSQTESHDIFSPSLDKLLWAYDNFKKKKDLEETSNWLFLFSQTQKTKVYGTWIKLLEYLKADPSKFMYKSELEDLWQQQELKKIQVNFKSAFSAQITHYQNRLSSLTQESNAPAATLIQKHTRGYLVRNRLGNKDEVALRNKVALRIQQATRTFIAKQKVSQLRAEKASKTPLTLTIPDPISALSMERLSEFGHIYADCIKKPTSQDIRLSSDDEITESSCKKLIADKICHEKNQNAKYDSLTSRLNAIKTKTLLTHQAAPQMPSETDARMIKKKSRLQSFLSRFKKTKQITYPPTQPEEVRVQITRPVTIDWKSLDTSCQSTIDDFNNQKSEFELKACSLANQPTLDPAEMALESLNLDGKGRRDIKIHDLTLAFIQGNAWAYQQLNPRLSQDDCQQLHELVRDYLMASRYGHQVTRLRKSISELETSSNPTEIQDKLSDILDECNITLDANGLVNIKERYDLQAHPEFMVFEHFSGMALRQSQIDNLIKLYQTGEDSERVVQMIMGSGKTKVLLPLLALKKANGTNLSMIIVPESLYKDVVSDMHGRTAHMFGRHTHTFSFERNTACEPKDLDKIMSLLERVKKHQHYLIVTSKTIHCLRLKYLEMLHQPGNQDKAQKLQQILAMFRNDGDVIIDEAHLILDCKHEVNFTLGEDAKPPQTQLTFLVKLHRLVATAIEGEPPSKEQLKIYIQETVFKALEQDQGCLGDEFKSCLAGNLKHWTKIKLFLEENGTLDDLDISKEHLELLYLLRQELNELLPLTYGKELHVNYGPFAKKGLKVAVPYVANNTPNESSRFDQIHELINYTTQMYIKRSIPDWILKEHLMDLKSNAKTERGKGIPIEKTTAVQTFKRFFHEINYDLLLRDDFPTCIKEIKKLFKTDLSALDTYIGEYILLSISSNLQTINSNSYDLVSMFKRVQGFTGTPWNRDTYHWRLTTDIEAGSDGKSLASVHKEGSKRDAIQALTDPNAEVKTIIKTLNFGENTRAFIDAGALFKGENNQTVAESLLMKCPTSISAVVFYRDNIPVVLTRKGEIMSFESCQIDPNDRFTYYDQYHATGTDIYQTPKAEAITSIGENLKIQDLFQGIWRMRQLAQSHSLRFVLSPQVTNRLGENKSDILAIIELCIKNQSQQQNDQLIQSCQTQFFHTLKEDGYAEILKKPINEIEPQQIEGLIRQKSLDPTILYRDAKKNVDRDEQISKFKEDVSKKAGDKPQLKIIEDMYSKSLPKTFIFPKHIGDTESEALAEVETEALKETEIQSEFYSGYLPPGMDKKFTYLDFFRPNDDATTIKIFDRKSFRQAASLDALVPQIKYEDETPFFSPQLKITENLMADHLRESHEKNKVKEVSSAAEEMTMKGQFQLNCQYILVLKLPDQNHQYFMLHKNEVGDIFEAYKKFQQLYPDASAFSPDITPQFAIYDINRGCQWHHSPFNVDHTSNWYSADPEFKKHLVQVKFFNGELFYDDDELIILQNWLNDYFKGISKTSAIFDPRKQTEGKYKSTTFEKLINSQIELIKALTSSQEFNKASIILSNTQHILTESQQLDLHITLIEAISSTKDPNYNPLLAQQIKEAQLYLNTQPDNNTKSHYLLTLLDSLILINSLDKAKDLLDDNVGKMSESDQSSAHLKLIEAFISSEEFDNAKAHLDDNANKLDERMRSYAHLKLIEAFISSGNIEAANAHLDDIADTDKITTLGMKKCRSIIHFEKVKHFVSSNMFEEAKAYLTSNSQEMTFRYQSHSHFEIIKAYISSGNIEEAKAYLEANVKNIDEEIDLPSAHLKLIEAFIASGNVDDAINHFEYNTDNFERSDRITALFEIIKAIGNNPEKLQPFINKVIDVIKSNSLWINNKKNNSYRVTLIETLAAIGYPIDEKIIDTIFETIDEVSAAVTLINALERVGYTNLASVIQKTIELCDKKIQESSRSYYSDMGKLYIGLISELAEIHSLKLYAKIDEYVQNVIKLYKTGFYGGLYGQVIAYRNLINVFAKSNSPELLGAYIDKVELLFKVDVPWESVNDKLSATIILIEALASINSPKLEPFVTQAIQWLKKQTKMTTFQKLDAQIQLINALGSKTHPKLDDLITETMLLCQSQEEKLVQHHVKQSIDFYVSENILKHDPKKRALYDQSLLKTTLCK